MLIPPHSGLCREGDKVAQQALHITLAQIKALFRQNHDAAAFRRFIGKRGELGGIGQRFSSTPEGRKTRGRAVAGR